MAKQRCGFAEPQSGSAKRSKVFRHHIIIMAKNGMNPKTLQYIMGHSDISVTLNTYTHVSFEDAQAEVKRMSAC